MKTGIIGGTFDPIHNAHVEIAKKAYEEYGLDQVLFMPSPVPPHKNSDEITGLQHRIEMIKIAIKDYPYFKFSDFELNRKGIAYSADTLTEYKAENRDEELYFIMGSDSLFTIDSWYHPQTIFDNATVLVAKRDDNTDSTLPEKIEELKEKFNARISEIIVNESDISSTYIRQHICSEKAKKYLPAQVVRYIEENGLYVNNKGSNRYTNAMIIDDLKKIQNSHRFEHTMQVALTAKKMAEALGENPNKAYLAGLLHDCAKCMENQELIDICEKNNIEITESEYESPFLLHGKAGAYLSENKYHITDDSILNAIKYHTTGKESMTLLEKIIFTADYIEPGRTKQKNLDLLRKIAYEDIDMAVYVILRDTLEYLKQSGQKNIDQNTQVAFEYYKKIILNRE